jgi:hypothetical protein
MHAEDSGRIRSSDGLPEHLHVHDLAMSEKRRRVEAAPGVEFRPLESRWRHAHCEGVSGVTWNPRVREHSAPDSIGQAPFPELAAPSGRKGRPEGVGVKEPAATRCHSPVQRKQCRFLGNRHGKLRMALVQLASDTAIHVHPTSCRSAACVRAEARLRSAATAGWAAPRSLRTTGATLCTCQVAVEGECVSILIIQSEFACSPGSTANTVG